jgi:hypothetical protein
MFEKHVITKNEQAAIISNLMKIQPGLKTLVQNPSVLQPIEPVTRLPIHMISQA